MIITIATGKWLFYFYDTVMLLTTHVKKKNQIDFTLTGLPVSVGELFLASIVGIFALKEQTFQT